MKRSPLPPRTKRIKSGKPPKRSGRPRVKPRTASEYQRIYGSKARVRWIKAHFCCCCEAVTGRNHNHHVVTGGTSRKADADKIVSLCPGCHYLLHTGELGRSKEWWLAMADLTDQEWQEVSGGD